MDEDKLRRALNDAFDPDPAVLDAVVREAKRLDQAGVWEDIFDEPLTAESLIDNLELADRSLKGSWNWWLGTNGSLCKRITSGTRFRLLTPCSILTYRWFIG